MAEHAHGSRNASRFLSSFRTKWNDEPKHSVWQPARSKEIGYGGSKSKTVREGMIHCWKQWQTKTKFRSNQTLSRQLFPIATVKRKSEGPFWKAEQGRFPIHAPVLNWGPHSPIAHQNAALWYGGFHFNSLVILERQKSKTPVFILEWRPKRKLHIRGSFCIRQSVAFIWLNCVICLQRIFMRITYCWDEKHQELSEKASKRSPILFLLGEHDGTSELVFNQTQESFTDLEETSL